MTDTLYERDSKAFVDRYEELRAQVLSRTQNGGLGLALFLNHGMLAWIRAWSKYNPVTPQQGSSGSASIPGLGSDTRSELTKILANIVLTHYQEKDRCWM